MSLPFIVDRKLDKNICRRFSVPGNKKTRRGSQTVLIRRLIPIKLTQIRNKYEFCCNLKNHKLIQTYRSNC